MKKILMSGNCRIGYVGEETELFDSYCEPLHTGDLVALSVYDKNNPESFSDYYGIEYICNNEFQDDGLDKKIFVMGIASEHLQYEDDYQETIVKQNHQEWRLRKVKGFEDTVNGEKWGAVRTVYVEDDFCL